MSRQLKLSNRVLLRVPVNKRNDNIKNLKWISRNILLSNSERQEIQDLINLKEEKRITK